MTALNQDQRFALLLILALAGCSYLLDITQAQTLTAEDRLSVLKFVGAFMNFLDMELENSTMATPPTGSVTEETTEVTPSNNSTEETTEAAITSDSTTTEEDSSSSEPTEPETITTTEATTTTVRRRMCFKRYCYKFGSDKGYIV